MFCRKCGKEIFDNGEYCDDCKNAVQKNELAKRRKCCPKCKSRNLQIVTNTEYSSQTKGGGYSASKGCCGLILTGPFGLLCGACGSKSKTTITSKSTTVWNCLDCGNKFRDIADIEKDIESTLKGSKIAQILLYFIAGIVLIPTAILEIWTASLGVATEPANVIQSIFLVILGVVCIMSVKRVKENYNNRIFDLNEEKKEIEKNGYTNE